MRLSKKDQKFLVEYEEDFLPNIKDKFFLLFGILSVISINSLWGDLLHPIVCIFLLACVIFVPCMISLRKQKRFLKNYGLTQAEATNYYHFISKDIKYAPLLQHFSQLNSNAKSAQIELMKRWFHLDDTPITEYIFDREYNESEWNIAIVQLKAEDIIVKKKIINRMFRLAILEDGIHNDEWNLLMQLAAQLQFKESYINDLWIRYESLRTEFDEYEKSESSSMINHSNYSLKEYFAVLGLSENATDKEIRRAYHELALQHHPDLPKNAGRTEECEKMMMKINEAYEQLRVKN